jgi:hypothetical protein
LYIDECSPMMSIAEHQRRQTKIEARLPWSGWSTIYNEKSLGKN